MTKVPIFGEVDCSGQVPSLDCSERIMIGYSVRNSAFDKTFFQSALEFIEEFGSRGIVAIFDEPYAYNDAAERGDSLPSPSDILKNRRIGDERARMIERIVKAKKCKKIEIWRWKSFEDLALISDLRSEMVAGLEKNELLRASLLKNAIEWLSRFGRVGPEHFLNFQIQEIPVLTYLYYYCDYLIDIYPGKNFAIFAELQEGRWITDLPMASNLAKEKKLTFINTSECKSD